LERQGIAIPERTADFEVLVADHLDRLWLSGGPRVQAGDVISGLQLFIPGLKGNLKAAWAALSVWQRHEEPERALPFTDEVADALAGQAVADGNLQLATAILLGQRQLLRPSEFCGLDLSRVVFGKGRQSRAVLDLGWTKGGQRKGVREGAVVEDDLLVVLLRYCCEEAGGRGTLLEGGPAAFLKLFGKLLVKLGLQSVGYTPYSLRRGGATSLMSECGDLKALAAKGRWAQTSTARIYVDGAAAQRTALRLTAVQSQRVETARGQLRSLL